MLLSLLPQKGKFCICIDRTEWDFGQCQVNVLMVLVGQGNFYIPFYWKLLDNKSGNSNSEDRITDSLSIVIFQGQQLVID